METAGSAPILYFRYLTAIDKALATVAKVAEKTFLFVQLASAEMKNMLVRVL